VRRNSTRIEVGFDTLFDYFYLGVCGSFCLILVSLTKSCLGASFMLAPFLFPFLPISFCP
jgi:hypothetical protein